MIDWRLPKVDLQTKVSSGHGYQRSMYREVQLSIFLPPKVETGQPDPEFPLEVSEHH